MQTEEAEDFVLAINRVYHNEQYSSRLILQVIEQEA
jgi:hypothetical protein